ncbi:MAG: ABC transporter permease [bacterium]
MKQFIIFVKKEFYHIFRDRWTMMILLLLPIIMLTLFGFAITTEVKNTKLAVYDPSKDVATRSIIQRLQANEYFILKKFISNPAEIEDEFQKGEVGLVLVFPEKFYENLVHTGEGQIQLITDGSDPNTAITLTNYASNIVAGYQQELNKISTIPYQIVPEVKLLYNPQLKGAYNFVPGIMGMILMLICAMMTSIAIAREKEKGTMELLLVSPVKPIIIIISKAVPYFFVSIVNLATILLLSVYVLDVPVTGSMLWLIIISMIYIFLSLALGLLISSVVNSQLVALLISGAILMMPVILLSGMIFPVESMPFLLQWLANIVPARWFIMAVRKLMIKGLDVTAIYKELIILSSMAVFFIIVSLKKFKNRLE